MVSLARSTAPLLPASNSSGSSGVSAARRVDCARSVAPCTFAVTSALEKASVSAEANFASPVTSVAASAFMPATPLAMTLILRWLSIDTPSPTSTFEVRSSIPTIAASPLAVPPPFEASEATEVLPRTATSPSAVMVTSSPAVIEVAPFSVTITSEAT